MSIVQSSSGILYSCITHTPLITIHSTSLEDNTQIHIIAYITMHNTSPDHITIHITLHTYISPYHTSLHHHLALQDSAPHHTPGSTHTHPSPIHKASTCESSLYNAMPSYTTVFLQDYKRRLIFSLVHIISHPQ